MRVFGLCGASGSGKTTLIERLIPLFRAAGRTVSTLKHTHHRVPLDAPGKDSDRHRRAGAREVMLVTEEGFALVHPFPASSAPPPLASLLARLAPADLVLIEGFKREPIPRLEVFRPALGKPPLWPEDPSILAIATDADGLAAPCPVLPLAAPEAIAAFIERHAKPL